MVRYNNEQSTKCRCVAACRAKSLRTHKNHKNHKEDHKCTRAKSPRTALASRALFPALAPPRDAAGTPALSRPATCGTT